MEKQECTHSTPACFTAYNISRNNYSDIARDIIISSKTDVIMGAGNPAYDDNGDIGTEIEDSNYKYVVGKDI